MKVRVTPGRGPSFPQPPQRGVYQRRTLRVVAQYFAEAPHEGISLAWERVTGEPLGRGDVARRIRCGVLGELSRIASSVSGAP